MDLASAYGVVRSLAIYYGQVWRRGRLENFYSQFLGPGKLGFDIGAHVGNRTRAWRRLDARVVAVEPSPDLLRTLRWFFGRDGKVTLVASAVGDTSGTTSMHINSLRPTLSSCSPDWIDEAKSSRRFDGIRWDRKISVPVTTLDQLIATHGVPDFCKIDIEGGELSALSGLSSAIPALSFECVSPMQERACDCLDRLDELGSYRYRYSSKETMKWSNDHWLDSEAMKSFLRALPSGSPAGDVYARHTGQSKP